MFEGITKTAGNLALGLAGFGLIFRSTLYWHIPVEPGESAGLGDILELMFYFTLLGFGAFLLVSSAVLLILKKNRPGLRAAGLGFLAPLIYHILHSYMPRLL